LILEIFREYQQLATRYKKLHWHRQIGINKCLLQTSGSEVIKEGKEYKTILSP
jgi:hypothetical protein